MSVITRLQVTPNRVAILFHFLKGYATGLKGEDLELLLSPGGLAGKEDDMESGSSTPREVLREAKNLGLVQENNDKVWVVPGPLRDLDAVGLLDYLEQRLVRPDLAKEYKQEKVPRALAWLLTQDPSKSLFWSEVPQRVVDEVKEYEMTSNSSYQQMGYWARYLGYAWRLELGKGSNFLVPDPTAALERHIRAILVKGQRMDIAGLMAHLAQRCPIMEGGAVRQELEERLPAEKRRPLNTLSASTSLALLRLSRRGVIHFERTADAEAMLLSAWAQSQPVSHVELLG